MEQLLGSQLQHLQHMSAPTLPLSTAARASWSLQAANKRPARSTTSVTSMAFKRSS
jgi:hypothetical protein